MIHEGRIGGIEGKLRWLLRQVDALWQAIRDLQQRVRETQAATPGGGVGTPPSSAGAFFRVAVANGDIPARSSATVPGIGSAFTTTFNGTTLTTTANTLQVFNYHTKKFTNGFTIGIATDGVFEWVIDIGDCAGYV